MTQRLLAFVNRNSRLGAFVGSVVAAVAITPYLADKMTTLNDGPILPEGHRYYQVPRPKNTAEERERAKYSAKLLFLRARLNQLQKQNTVASIQEYDRVLEEINSIEESIRAKATN
eukprot:TRINITY_DN5680_c0_g1_i1.p1 TRINITY_DN5680_c0_g1~~TRINITY_DN5680_c0_g1_i1.p1  ORF type:complete len:116 (-),score=32.48 TRINITY_DN5680_c0_g1_i1:110-457(-)